MAGLQEETRWENEIYRIEENDPVHGGEDGITNKPLKQLANRTKYLKAEVEKRYIAQDASTEQKGLVQLDSSTDSNAEDKAATPRAINAVKVLVTAVRSALSNYIPNSKKSNDDNSTSSDTVATSYAVKKVRDIATKKATDTVAGQTVLSHKTDGTDKSKAASEFALGELNKELAGKGVPIGSVVAFPKGITPQGYLLGNGGPFSRQTYPDLYQALGVEILPNLNRSDVGMTAYFVTDSIPDGWIAFDSIRTTVTQQSYPELYKYLVAKYGSIAQVPLAEDRFIRNAGNGLIVGQTQSDEIKKHVHTQALDDGSRDENKFNSVFDKNSISDYDYNLNIGLPVDNGYSDNFWATPRLDSRLATGGDETRPKSIALKLCIKTKNTFDDVVFWIKAFGEVTNSGTLDASRLAQDLQNKADLSHRHQSVDIIDFEQSVNQIVNQTINQHFTYQKIGDFEVRKYPDGTMIQTCSKRATSGDYSQIEFIWAVAFINRPSLVGTARYENSVGDHDTIVTFVKGNSQSKCVFVIGETYNNSGEFAYVDIVAIGRWK
ncbi:TPA: tail fiber protein [Pasteurella multocida]|nr:tail fiber protein [Pasteurella multocida]HDR1014587.1 tail fiber protein [Pasteurella multocida]HDR1016994.1 tail fiber protein [Pasteurella multocida]HDR1125523.1 tail fiber protein [Pasteurella multocida]HDR1208631.1 tail fiber protein [Pasteurella multocida]